MKTKILYIVLLVNVISFSQTTAIPDTNFEAYLEANGMGDGISNNHMVTTANIVGVTTLILENLGIADLTGIEDFDALDILFAENNAITTVSFSTTQNITTILLSNNSITTVPDLQYQTNATTITLSDNPINSATLDLTQNVNLNNLDLENSTLSSLDVTQNVNLTSLRTVNNNLTFLDLTNNPVLTNFEAFLNDPNLCIQVTDQAAAYAGTGIYANWIKDQSATYSLNCNSCENNLLINGNFDAASCGGDAFGLGCVPNWSVDRGTPTLGGFPTNPYAWMWSWGTIGEGIAANFNFIAGTTYTISFRIRTDDMNTGCDIVADTATVNLMATNGGTNNEYIFNDIMGPYLNNWYSVSVTYIPNANYSQLLVFPYMEIDNGQCQAELSIDDICIIEGVLGVEDYNTSSILLYPNPTKDFATITIDTDATYTMVNINGQKLQQGKFISGDNPLDVSQYASGLYFINIKSDTSSSTLKLIKQ